MSFFKTLVILGMLIIVGSAGFIYSGLYPMGADVPHNQFTYWVLETLRERSIQQASKDIEVPELDGSELLLSGGPDYNEMCASCHLQPGKVQSDMSLGLYPGPPNLAKSHADDNHGEVAQAARRQFWIIKHGIKASGMPAWGETHDDGRIWAMVAFLRKLPELTPVQYQILTARGDDAPSNH